MQEYIRNVSTHYKYKSVYLRYINFLGQVNLQRGYFVIVVPISYTVIPVESVCVHVVTCLPWGKHQPPV